MKPSRSATTVFESFSAGNVAAALSSKLRNVPIVWKLHAPAGFSFATDGINFKNKELASKQFVTSRVSSHEYVWEDANTAYGTFPYNIKVRQEGRDCPVLDPTVVNDD